MKLVAFAKERQDLDRLLPVATEVTKNLDQMMSRWSASPFFNQHVLFAEHAVKEFREQDYVSCTSIVYPRIEGVLRVLHQALGVTEKASQTALTAAAVEARSGERHQHSWLLPEMFRRYMKDAYFAPFAPGQAPISRNSVGHGVATVDRFDLKAACLGLLILDQLTFFMPSA